MLVNRLRFSKGFHFWGCFGLVGGVFLPRRSRRVFTKDAKVFLCW